MAEPLDIVALAEAVELVGGNARQWLSQREIPGRRMARATLWRRSEIVRALAGGVGPFAPPPDVVGVGEIAKALEIAKPNVRGWARARRLEPTELACGPWWDRAVFDAAPREDQRSRRPTVDAAFCVHNHELTPENTIERGNGRRECRACHLESKRRYRERQKS